MQNRAGRSVHTCRYQIMYRAFKGTHFSPPTHISNKVCSVYRIVYIYDIYTYTVMSLPFSIGDFQANKKQYQTVIHVE